MRILLVAATGDEVAPIVARMGQPTSHAGSVSYTYAGHELHVLIAGVGMVATAAWCGRALAPGSYQLALNVGVCGSFDRELGPGRVVHVASDRIAELGAEDDARFMTVDELNLPGWNKTEYARSLLVNASPPDNRVLQELPTVSGITVNTVHGNEASIQAVIERFHPQVESMEGAAFMYACLINAVPFAQVRAVSNVVERRNRQAWRLAEAIGALAETTLRIIEAA